MERKLSSLLVFNLFVFIAYLFALVNENFKVGICGKVFFFFAADIMLNIP